ncbi:MAG: DNA-processing protein DprA [Pseudomonadota bacterium]
MTPELAALALHSTPDLSKADKYQFVDRVGGLAKLASARDAELAQAGMNAATRAIWRTNADSGFPDDLEWTAAHHHTLLTLDHPAYPEAFRALADAPIVLWAIGDLDLLAPAKIALVGSRNPTRTGEESARAFAATLAQHGLGVVSGLASGIDTAAHRGALDVDGMTVAVIGTGADRVYPATNRALAHEIAEKGLVLSEFPLGSPPRQHHFPQRNRLISALSTGVLVVEATVRSGSLITARLAGEQGRAVMAIPGSIHNPMARGCHRLIREGARLVESCDDVLEEIGPMLATHTEVSEDQTSASKASTHDEAIPEQDSAAEMPRAHRALLDCLDYDPLGVDELVERSGEPIEHVSSMLLLLELGGHIKREKDGRFSRRTATSGTIDA